MDNKDLEKTAKSVRKRIFQFTTKTGWGHLASSLSCVDILVSLYCDEKTLFDHKKDILIFSKTHASPAIYPILVDLGLVPEKELEKYCTPEGVFRMHADGTIPGCHFVGGSLGNGIGYAAGLAHAFGPDKRIFVLLGDAELYEGSIWESLMFIAHHRMNHLTVVVDRNGLGILGETEKLLRLEPLEEKFASFGFETCSIDGHCFNKLRDVFSRPPGEKPTAVIAKTVKGKGVSYMEGVWQYHTIIPKEEDLIQLGLKELS